MFGASPGGDSSARSAGVLREAKRPSPGRVLGVFGFVFALLMGFEAPTGFAVGLSILGICAWANVVGALVPLVAQQLGIDPTVMSAPMITTLVDATGLFIYFLVAGAVLGL